MLQENDTNREASSTAEQPTPTPSESAEAKGWRDCVMTEIKQQQKADNDARNEPNLRTEMCRVIDELGHMLDDHAAALAHQEGDAGAFNMDIKKDLIVWQLAEYLIRGYLERDPIEPPITRGWQVTELHAFDFFRVSALADHSLVALEVEESRS